MTRKTEGDRGSADRETRDNTQTIAHADKMKARYAELSIAYDKLAYATRNLENMRAAYDALLRPEDLSIDVTLRCIETPTIGTLRAAEAAAAGYLKTNWSGVISHSLRGFEEEVRKANVAIAILEAKVL